MIAIAGIGLCTAQGNAAAIAAGGPLAPPRPLPFAPSPRAVCRVAFTAAGIDPELRGAARWRALAEAALAEAGGDPARVPISLGSCNGGADTADAAGWRDAFAAHRLLPGLAGDPPIASAACASGLHALWLAAARLEAGECDEIIALAVDLVSPASHDHFESLRVLAPAAAPWQPTATGFVPGEAAVALRLVCARAGDGLPRLAGPLLAHDRDGGDALAQLAAALATPTTAAVLGQGTGPAAVDARELAALATVPPGAPLATPLAAFGHTVGAAGLLSVALAALAQRGALGALSQPAASATDGRRLGAGWGETLVVCRALGGACAAAVVGATTAAPPQPLAYSTPSPAPPLHAPILRRLAAEALAHRPAAPPAALVIRLAAPLVPPDAARINGRLLPSAVLEMTPGFTAQLVARAWGYTGPALALVGGSLTLPLPAGAYVVYVGLADVGWDHR